MATGRPRPRDILLTGGTGQLGTELRRLSWPDGLRLHAPDRAALDLSDARSVEFGAGARRWAAILSCGAYTAVDAAETDARTAWSVNALAPTILAEAAARAGCPIVHVSTDYVFSGDKPAAYIEDDPVAPLGVYGASKEGGERAVRAATPRHAVLRTAWLMSAHGRNFLKTMLRLAGERNEVRVVADQIGSPTSASDLAAAVQHVTLRMIAERDAPCGTFHLANAGEASWADVAEAVFAASLARGGPTARVVRIGTADYPTPARRPANSRLATGKAADAFGLTMRDWQPALTEIVTVLG